MGCCKSKSAALVQKRKANAQTTATQSEALLDAERGDMRKLKQVMNWQDDGVLKKSTLHLACKDNRFRAVEFMLSNGVDVMVRDAVDHTCLHEAAGQRSCECMELLLKHGKLTADVTATTNNLIGFTPLQAMVAKIGAFPKPHELNEKCIKLLLSHGADPQREYIFVAQGTSTTKTAASYALQHFKDGNRLLLALLLNEEQKAVEAQSVADAEAQRTQDAAQASEKNSKFLSDLAERTLRIVVRVKNIALSTEAQDSLKAQLVAEVGQLSTLRYNSDEERTASVNTLATLLADEIVLMVDDQGCMDADIMKGAAALYYTQVNDAAKAKSDEAREKQVRDATAAASARRAEILARAAAITAARNNKHQRHGGEQLNPLAGKFFVYSILSLTRHSQL